MKSPAWMDYYDPARLKGFKGFAYLTAGQPAEARTALSEALAQLDTSAVKQRAVFFTDLATIHVHEGEIDQGAELAGQAAVELTRLAMRPARSDCRSSATWCSRGTTEHRSRSWMSAWR